MQEGKELEEEEIVEGVLIDNNVIVSGEKATATYEAGFYGSILEEEKLGLEIVEALLLIERKRLKVFDEKKQELDFQNILKDTLEVDPKIWTKYFVYRDLRSRGYIVRLGYGGGVDFRVNRRNPCPGDREIGYRTGEDPVRADLPGEARHLRPVLRS